MKESKKQLYKDNILYIYIFKTIDKLLKLIVFNGSWILEQY